MENKDFWEQVENCLEKTLWGQLELLAERSQKCESCDDLAKLSGAMVDIARTICPR